MNTALWVVAWVLAVVFVGAGLMNVIQPKEWLVSKGMGAIENFSPTAIKVVGALEVLGGLGVVLPALVGVAPVLVPIAAVGLCAVMIGALVLHVRRKEYQMLLPPVLFLAAAVFLAWGRFGTYAFAG